jgi:hypothetical protein
LQFHRRRASPAPDRKRLGNILQKGVSEEIHPNDTEPKKSNLTIPCMVRGSKDTNRRAVVTLHQTTLFPMKGKNHEFIYFFRIMGLGF